MRSSLCAVVPLAAAFTIALFTQAGAADSTDKLQAEAVAAELRGDAPAALDLLARAIKADPESASAYRHRATLYGKLGKHAESVADWSEVIKLAPKDVNAYQQRGTERFKNNQMGGSLADFDRVLELEPSRRREHWQRGIVCYYVGKYKEGQKQFEDYQEFQANDVENVVWRFLCMARADGVEAARKAILPVAGDSRVPMMEIYALFRGDIQPADVLAAAEKGNASNDEDRKGQRFYAHLYLGLYYEAIGDAAHAKEHIDLADQKYPTGGYMWEVAHVHAQRLAKAKK